MYDELIKRLKSQCYDCKLWDGEKCCLKGDCSAHTRLEAADTIEELSKELERSKEWEKFWEKEANEALKKFQTTVAKIPHWTPVTERLPKADDKRFLVCAKRFNGEPYVHICYHAKNLHEFDEYDFPNENRPGWYFYDSEYGWVEKEDVTHWMPLPNPPRESEP